MNQRMSSPSEGAVVGAERLLGRGSRILGLASVAHACGDRAGADPWSVLSEETVAAADEVLRVLEQKPDPRLLEAAICAALSPEPATAPPKWAKPIMDAPEQLERVGQLTETAEVLFIAETSGKAATHRIKGLAALAIGLSHKPDSLQAVARALPRSEEQTVLRMASLAQVAVDRSLPSTLRSRIRGLLEKFNPNG